MDLEDTLRTERKLIESGIADLLDREIDDSLDDPLTRPMMEAIKEFTLRDGKRIRAILLVMGYRAVGGNDLNRARAASVSLELIQSMLLIHDDLIDRSPERRGGPSLHKLFESHHGSKGYRGDGSRFGINMAIIGGDLAESLGEKALSTSGFPPENTLDALTCQADMIRDTGFGQILDLYSEALPEWSEEMVIKVQKFKTARYTLEGPLHIGAKLKGVSVEQLKALSDYAIPVGIAFQIIDDILGFYGDPRRGGREDIADIKEGKRTLLIMKALELGNDDERSLIMAALGNKDLTVEEAGKVRSIIRNTGSEEYSRKMAQELSQKGINALEGSDMDLEVVEFLKDLADYLLSRA